jgi:hypothetical protein
VAKPHQAAPSSAAGPACIRRSRSCESFFIRQSVIAINDTREWLEAVCQAPSIKDDFYTILSEQDQTTEVETMIEEDSNLRGCFTF